MGKGQTVRLIEQSTHAEKGKQVPVKSVSSTLLEQRVKDGHFIRLIRKWLKAGILEEEGHVLNPTTGTPQGGIISPILANIYLHYVFGSLD